MLKNDPITSFLLQEKIVDDKGIEALQQEQQQSGRSMVSILKEKGLINEDQFTRLIAVSNEIEFVNLSPEMIEPMVAHLVSYDVANRYNAIPIKKDGHNLYVAMSSPLNLSARDQLENRTGYSIVPVAATPSAVRQAIHYHFDVTSVTRQAIVSMRLKVDDNKEQDPEAEDLSERNAQDPITKLVSSIIKGAVDAGASDIHLEPHRKDLRVRYRVDGLLRDTVTVPASAQLEVISHIKIKSEMDISERRVPQDGHMNLVHDGKEYDLRVSSLPAVGGEKIVIRILDKNADKWSIDSVVTNPEDNRKFKELANNPYGMFLLTGPTGSGKTTTLYSVLQLINTPQRNIVTVEDPVEYQLDGITQVQVRPAAGMTFASALRSILRQDPDIILIGEIRDLETAEIAVSAALTGHLVLSTLHTNDAAGAISRLINLGVPPFLVGSALLGAVGQRLLRTNCPKCAIPYKPDDEDVRLLLSSDTENTDFEFRQGNGCNNCYQTGYQGRKSIYEILTVTPEIKRMILNGDDDDEIKKTAIKQGMRTLRKSAVEEVLNGSTTTEEVMRVVDFRGD